MLLIPSCHTVLKDLSLAGGAKLILLEMVWSWIEKIKVFLFKIALLLQCSHFSYRIFPLSKRNSAFHIMNNADFFFPPTTSLTYLALIKGF